MQHDNVNDGDRSYVVIGEDNVVLPTCDTVNGMYVSRVVFNFAAGQVAGAEIWLYAMRKNGTTNQFTPVASYLIGSTLLPLDGGLDGIRIVNLNNSALSVAPGDYIGLGFNSRAHSCYRSPLSGQYRLLLADAGFATLSTQTYTPIGDATPAFTFDVRNI